jgi:calmodulin
MENTLHSESVDTARDLFDKFDEVTHVELGFLLRAMQVEITDSDVNDLISKVNADRSGSLQFNEFMVILSKSLSGEKTNLEEIDDAYTHLSNKGSGNSSGSSHGLVTANSLFESLKGSEESLKMEEVREMVEEVNVSNAKNGITREDFRIAFESRVKLVL